jgi:hypothetical protein
MYCKYNAVYVTCNKKNSLKGLKCDEKRRTGEVNFLPFSKFFGPQGVRVTLLCPKMKKMLKSLYTVQGNISTRSFTVSYY